MRVLPFARYAVESVIRNRRRSLFAIIGIVLALSLVAGSSIAVDSSAFGLLRAALEDVPTDFVAYDSNSLKEVTDSYIQPRIQAIESVKYVREATPLVSLYQWGFSNGTVMPEASPYLYSSMVFISQSSDTILDAYRINGTYPDRGTVAISKELADDYNLAVGNNVTCTWAWDNWYVNETGYYMSNWTYHNLSFEISEIWTQDWNEDTYWLYDRNEYDNSLYIEGNYNPVVFNLEDYASVRSQAEAFGYSNEPTINYLIWIDRNDVISLSDVPASVDKLGFIQHRLESKGYSLGFSVGESGLVYALEELYPQLEGMKILFLVLSLPVIALGLYLSIVGVDLGVTERRREVGILKSRGASNRQVFGSLLIESLVLGVGAGILGLVLGLGVSRFLLDVATTFVYESPGRTHLADYRITLGTVLLAVGFGVLLTLLSSYRPFKKVSKTDVAEALHHYSPIVTQVEYKPRTDIILLFLASLSILGTTLGPNWAMDRGWSWITVVIVSVLLFIGLILLPAMPFFLSLSVTRLLTRTSWRLYAKFTRIVKPWTKELHHLVDRNIVRNPRRASNLCVIISLALAFGIFISVTMESSMAYEEESIKYRVGADARVTGYYWGSYSQDFNLENLSALEHIDGIERLSSFRAVTIIANVYGTGSYWRTAALLNHSTYAEVVDPSDFYFIDGGSEMLDELAVNGTVLLPESMAKEADIIVGDFLNCAVDLNIYLGNGSYINRHWDFVLVVAGFVKGLPGLPDYGMYLDRETLDFIDDVNLTYAYGQIGYFVDFEQGADQEGVVASMENILAESGFSPSSEIRDVELERLRTGDPQFQAMADFLYLEYALSVAIMTVGVGLLIFVAVNDRQQEIACIMARGSSGSQMRKILMGESVTLMVIGLIIGISVGLLTAYLFNALSGEALYTAVERRLVFTYLSWGIVLASIASLLLASFLATARAGKIKLAEVLRIRGG